jgi:hypothetical protein
MESNMIKFWVEWLDGTLITSIYAENEQQAINKASRELGLAFHEFKIKKAC